MVLRMRFENIFAGKTITLMGLGGFDTGSGISAALFLAPLCKKLIITDMKSRAQLAGPLAKLRKFRNISYHLGRHREEDFVKTDWVVRNPDVPANSPYLALATSHGIPIDNDVTIFLRLVSMRHVIGVTGTRGKSTTTHLIHAMLREQFPDARIGGNMGVSPLTFIKKMKKDAPVVLELSSFMLHEFAGLQQSPHIGVWTTLYPDHLNKYESLEHYIDDKRNIFRYQGAWDVAIVNVGDPVVAGNRALCAGDVRTYGARKKKDRMYFAPFLSASKLLGDHNIGNIMAAVRAAQAYGVRDAAIIRAIKKFRGVPYRLELVRTLGGVRWYCDSTATSPEAAIAALKSFPKKSTIIITGGNTKGSDLSELKKVMRAYAREIILMPGNANSELPSGIEVASLEDAVATARRLATKGDVVLLSPGLTWLPKMNEFERGDVFKKFVRS